jgi:hypothetical protein
MNGFRPKMAIVMGIVILVADVYWTYTSYYDMVWLLLGIIIFLADLVWIYLDYEMGKKRTI